MDLKVHAFQKLKPPCVALSQAALALQGPGGDLNAVLNHLESLESVLDSLTGVSGSLDVKLAEYVFFPISQILKASQKVPVRVLEICLQCIAILLEQGWRGHLPAQLAAQIVILCTLLAERQPRGLVFKESTDELQTCAFECLHQVFSSLSRGSDGAETLTREANFPQLGQTISVILDGLELSGSVGVQIAGTNALNELVSHVFSKEVAAAFLPGIMSRLTKVLTPKTKLRRNYQVLARCLNVVQTLLQSTMSDGLAITTAKQSDDQQLAAIDIDRKWQAEAAHQLKAAITGIVKLKSHSKEDVRIALEDLCVMILEACQETLANCSRVALETLITLCSASSGKSTYAQIEYLMIKVPTIVGTLQSMLYDWLQSITTVLQGSDEEFKSSRLQHTRTIYALLMKVEANTSTVDRMLANTLRDSVIVTLASPASRETTTFAPPLQALELAAPNSSPGNLKFASALIQYKAQESTMKGLEDFVDLIASRSTSTAIAADLGRQVQQSDGEARIASFWLLLTTIQSTFRQTADADELLNLESTTSPVLYERLEELYSHSLSTLSGTDETGSSVRLRALALRTLAFRAQRAGRDFRYELVDALYPVLNTLATPDATLQQDSITTLEILTSACGYASVRDLIVDNVDYLTNAVALKLNAFDVSPQAPQVLLMMVRLAGSSLLPYLEDTVESIFAALEDYHGYPRLVELLFRVLAVIGEEGAKAPQLAIAGSDSPEISSTLVERWYPSDMSHLTQVLHEHAQSDREITQSDTKNREPHLKQPWKDEAKNELLGDEMNIDGERDRGIESTESSPPAAKTYNLLLKITDLTQHFLPSASATLRTSLLSLIRTTVPAVAKHENSFLPLINTLWPEVISRLDDDEVFVVAQALSVIKVLCEHAREFMRTRITSLWPRLQELHDSSSNDANQGALHKESLTSPIIKKDSPLATNELTSSTNILLAIPDVSSIKLLKTNLVDCLTAIVKFVPIMPEMLDQTLDMLEETLEQDNVHEAFTVENHDALWLSRLRRGVVRMPSPPPMPGDVSRRFALSCG